mgnify:CR=1 FL=1
MDKKSGTSKGATDKLVRGIRRKTRKHHSAEEENRIVMAGLHGDEGIAATTSCHFLDRGNFLSRMCPIRIALLYQTGEPGLAKSRQSREIQTNKLT